MRMAESASSSLMHDFTASKKTAGSSSMPKVVVFLLAAVLLGAGSGYLLAKHSGPTVSRDKSVPTYSVQKGKTFGSDDTKAYPDTAEGKLQTGGIEGEGAYHLVRPGGDSQNVYLTSSEVDLSQFVNKQIEVWGKTQAAQHAGWLMDVGRVEVQ